MSLLVVVFVDSVLYMDKFGVGDVWVVIEEEVE